MSSQKNICSFCGKNNLQIEKLIAGKNASICNDCLQLAGDALKQEKQEAGIINDFWDISPKKIKAEFDQYVIGQEEAKKHLAVIISNHYKRLLYKNNDLLNEDKVNLLMIGPTSSGKTLMLKVLQKFLGKKGIPVALADATTLTEAGYVGDDVETILLRLLQEADFNVEKAEKGIVFIDEIDKIANRSSAGSLTRDISGEGVQHALLGLLQGRSATVQIGNKKNINQENIQINTADILFICAGAFSGLEKIVNSRVNEKSVGFHHLNFSSQVQNFKNVENEDLIKFGMIPEFLGRLPSVVTLNELTIEELIKVLTEPKNAILKQYQSLFQSIGAELIFTPEGIKAIAELTISKKINTRGLKNVIEKILSDTMYNLEDLTPCRVIVDKEAVLNKQPKIETMEQETLAIKV